MNNNLPEGFLENRLQELLADDEADALRPGFTPAALPRVNGQVVNFDQLSDVSKPVSFDQPSPHRGTKLSQPTPVNFDQPSGRQKPSVQAPSANQPTRPPQRAGQPKGNLDPMRQSSDKPASFDQLSQTSASRRASFDSPSRIQTRAQITQYAPQNNGTDWSSSLLNSISTYDEKTQPDTAELLQGALEALTDAVIITDCNGRLTWVNRYASELLDMSATGLMGTPASAVFGKYAAAFIPAELLLLAPNGRLNDWQISLLLPSAIRRTMVFNFALTRRNGEQVVVAIGHEYRETPTIAAPVPNAPPTQRTPAVERVTVRLRPDNDLALKIGDLAAAIATPHTNNSEKPMPVQLDAPVPPTIAAPPINAHAKPAIQATKSPDSFKPELAEPLHEIATPATIPSSDTTATASLTARAVIETMVASSPVTQPTQTHESVANPALTREASAMPSELTPLQTTTATASIETLLETSSTVATTTPMTDPTLTETTPNASAIAEGALPTTATTQEQSTSTETEPAETTAAQFWQFLEFAPEPMMVTDQRGRIVQLNRLAEGLFGYDRTEMLGEKALALLAKKSRDPQQTRFPFGITNASRNGISELVETIGWHRDGSEFPLALTRRQTEDGHFVVLTLRPIALLAPTPPAADIVPSTSPTTRPNPEAHSTEEEVTATPSLILTFNEHLRRHNRALGELSRSTAWEKQGLPAALAEITAVAAQALDTARVSIWLFNEARTEIICQDLFEVSDKRHSTGLVLAAKSFPHYFAALAADRTITAHNAQTDERTVEFKDSYLIPNGISSMLAAPIRALSHQLGVVCHEHIGEPRNWIPEDETFAASVADFVAMAYEAEQRQAAQASQARLAAVLQATPDCVSITDASGRLTFLNEAARSLVERTKDQDISDLVIADLYPPTVYARLESEIVPDAIQNGIWTGELTLRRADGSEMPVTQITFVQQREQGEIEFIAHIHHDLSVRKQMEEERDALLEHEQQLRRSAEEHIQHKDDFLSTISHELRTPLTGIVGWIELIRSGTLDDDALERALATIERDAQTQMKLVDDLLDASRAISEKLTLDTRPLELMHVVAAALDTVRPQIEEKDIRLNITFQPWVGPFVGDESRLQQVVWNLLSNAVKFTPQGGVIEVLLERNQRHAIITVRDSGIGIKPEFLPHLFERFRQQEGSSVRGYGGLGLGLAIAKHIVELHQGTITAQSKGENQGTEFTVSLPLAQNQPASLLDLQTQKDNPVKDTKPATNKGDKSRKQRPPLLAGVRVLTVDDQAGARDLFHTVLTQYQAEVRLAASAEEARQMLATWKPDILVSDIGMPNEDGCAMIRHIRALPPDQGGQIPAIALTAYVSEQDRLRALQAGFDVHLSKPVNPTELAKTVAQLVKRNHQPSELHESVAQTVESPVTEVAGS